jgi:hypothetical protein
MGRVERLDLDAVLLNDPAPRFALLLVNNHTNISVVHLVGSMKKGKEKATMQILLFSTSRRIAATPAPSTPRPWR